MRKLGGTNFTVTGSILFWLSEFTLTKIWITPKYEPARTLVIFLSSLFTEYNWNQVLYQIQQGIYKFLLSLLPFLQFQKVMNVEGYIFDIREKDWYFDTKNDNKESVLLFLHANLLVLFYSWLLGCWGRGMREGVKRLWVNRISGNYWNILICE